MADQQIGDVARRFGIPVETIRYYERSGLLNKPIRTGSNYRLYCEDQIEQLGFILNCRNLDMTHEEIRRLLELRSRPPRDCTEVNVIIDEHVAHIDQRITELRALSEQLHELRASCNEIRRLQDCKIITTLRRRPASKQVGKSHIDAHARRKPRR